MIFLKSLIKRTQKEKTVKKEKPPYITFSGLVKIFFHATS